MAGTSKEKENMRNKINQEKRKERSKMKWSKRIIGEKQITEKQIKYDILNKEN